MGNLVQNKFNKVIVSNKYDNNYVVYQLEESNLLYAISGGKGVWLLASWSRKNEFKEKYIINRNLNNLFLGYLERFNYRDYGSLSITTEEVLNILPEDLRKIVCYNLDIILNND